MNRLFSILRSNWKSLLYCIFIVATFFPRRHIINLTEASSTGWFIDAFSLSLYSADFIFFAIFIANFKNIISAYYRHALLVSALLFLLFTESIYVNDALLALYFSFRIIQFFILLYLFKNWLKEDRSFYYLLYTIVVLATLQSFIGIFQYIYGQSLGLGFLGESILATNLPGVAKIAIGQGNRILRAYGTFPHPNILAGFILAAIACVTYAGIEHGRLNKTIKILLFLIFIGLLITFSRTAIISAFFVLLYIRFRMNQNRLTKKLLFLLLIFFLIFSFAKPASNSLKSALKSRIFSPLIDNSISDRILLSQNAIQIINTNLLGGIGSGQYIKELIEFHPIGTLLEKWQYDYPHNILLVIIAEFGIIGILAFMYIIFKILGQKQEIILWVLFLISPIILFDHYLWTQQTGRIIFILLLVMLTNLVRAIEFKRP